MAHELGRDHGLACADEAEASPSPADGFTAGPAVRKPLPPARERRKDCYHRWPPGGLLIAMDLPYSDAEIPGAEDLPEEIKVNNMTLRFGKRQSIGLLVLRVALTREGLVWSRLLSNTKPGGKLRRERGSCWTLWGRLPDEAHEAYIMGAALRQVLVVAADKRALLPLFSRPAHAAPEKPPADPHPSLPPW